MRRFPADVLVAEGEVVLGRDASHHLLDVVRVRRGESVVLFDGEGREATATLADVRDERAVLQVTAPVREARPSAPLHLLLGLPKGNAADDAVRMATEAGATHVHPTLCARSIAKGDRGERWQRIARSAAQQCGRADVPEVLPLAPLVAVLDRLPADVDGRVALPGAGRGEPATGPAAVLVGPEGGLTDEEVALALSRGMRPLGLGAWVLRTETAAAVAVASVAPAG